MKERSEPWERWWEKHFRQREQQAQKPQVGVR